MDDFDTDSQCAYPDCDSGNKADSRCGRCRKAYYCSRRCQRKHWKDHKPTCEPVEDQTAGQEASGDGNDLKEAHVKLRVEHEELEREHEKLKRHKRDRSLIYQAEIQKLQEAVVDTEVEKDKALEEERLAEEAAKNNNGDQPPEQRDRKHNRQRSVYYQEQLQKLQENLREAEKEKDEALARAKLIASDPSVPPELQKSGYMEDGYLDPKSNKYSFAELSKGKVSGINKRKKELYLTDEEFSIVFEKPRDEFNNLKEWQKQKIKRDVGLF